MAAISAEVIAPSIYTHSCSCRHRLHREICNAPTLSNNVIKVQVHSKSDQSSV